MRISTFHLVSALLFGRQVIASPLPATNGTNTTTTLGGDDGKNTTTTTTTTTTNSQQFLPGAYIIEFADDNDSPDSFVADLAADLGVDVEVRLDLRHKLFKGVSFQVKNSTAAGALPQGASSDALVRRSVAVSSRAKKIWPVRILNFNSLEDSTAPQPASPSDSALYRRQGQDQYLAKDAFSTHVQTQVDRLRGEGITGKGVRVAVIDGGVDYTHPALGGCFGPGCLVETGWDFVGDDYMPGASPAVPDPDPMDACEGHGTHVAGTIAAQLAGNRYGFTGAAPGVKLAAYRIWGCPRTGVLDIKLAAFARAFDDGSDIISCSDGDVSGWADDAWSSLATRIVDAGVPVVISAGNDGGMGLFYPSSPSNARGIASTGSVANQVYPALLKEGTYTVDGVETKFGFLPNEPAAAVNVTGLGLWSAQGVDNACSPLPDDTPALDDKFVLLEVPKPRVTGCWPNDQAENVAAKGAKYIIYYDRDNRTVGDITSVFAAGIEGVSSVPAYVADLWTAQQAAGSSVNVSIPAGTSAAPRLETLGNTVNGGLPSTFSSWGPSWELELAPRFMAPGEQVLSTYPVAKGGYRTMSGTSMAAPLVAGVHALLREVLGPLSPARLRNLLTITARPLTWFDGKVNQPDVLAPVAQQGAGLVQAWNAVHGAAISTSVDGITFNDTDNFVAAHTFSISNSADAPVSFRLGHRVAPTMNYLFSASGVAGSFPNRIVDAHAALAFSSDMVVVPARGSANVTVTCTPPATDTVLMPVYGGFITLDPVDGGNKDIGYVLPYLGVVGSMRSQPVLDASRAYLADFNIPAAAGRAYTVKRPDPTKPPRSDLGDQSSEPNVYLQPVMGTRVLEVNLLSSDGDDLGAIYEYPIEFASREERRAFFRGLLADGTVVAPGTYSFRIRALRVYGGRGRVEDWDVIETTRFSLQYAS